MTVTPAEYSLSIDTVNVNHENRAAALAELTEQFRVWDRGERLQLSAEAVARVAIEIGVNAGGVLMATGLLALGRALSKFLRPQPEQKPPRIAFSLTVTDGQRSKSITVATDSEGELGNALVQITHEFGKLEPR